jgi:hypothetical protein
MLAWLRSQTQPAVRSVHQLTALGRQQLYKGQVSGTGRLSLTPAPKVNAGPAVRSFCNFTKAPFQLMIRASGGSLGPSTTVDGSDRTTAVPREIL